MAVNTFHYGAAPLLTPPPIADLQQLREPCIESPLVGSFKLDERAWANETAKTSLQLLYHRIMKALKAQPKTSCTSGIIGGTAASLLTKSPFPFLMGISECFPTAHAQQKVGSEFQVNNYTFGTQSTPSVIGLRNGNFVVAWNSQARDGSVQGVSGQLFYGNSTKIGSEFQVNTYTIDGQHNPSVATLNNDKFVVAWQSLYQDGDNYGIYGQFFDYDANKTSSEFQINTYTISAQVEPSIASFNNGNFVVIWLSLNQDGSNWGIYGQLFNESGSKIGSEFLANTHTDNNQRGPSVSTLRNGNFIVTWHSQLQDGSAEGVHGQLFNENATKMGNEFQINTFTSGDQTNPSIVNLNDNNFIVTWQSDGQDGSGFGIYGQLFNENATKFENEFQINTFTSGDQVTPSVANLKDSHFIVTWKSQGQDGSGTGIYGQLFKKNATKMGNEFQINTITAGAQADPSVANLNDSHFIVTWSGPDVSGAGIYGQIFHDNITYPPSSTSTSSSTTSTINTITTTTTTSTSNFDPSSRTSSTDSTTSSSLKTIDTSKMSSEIIPTASNPNNRFLWLWVLLGIAGGTTCIGLTGYFLHKKRREQQDTFPSELETFHPIIRESHFSSEREEKGHTKIGGKYYLLNKIAREEAKALLEQTGISVEFPEGQHRTKVLFGQGNFGKIRLARDLYGYYIGVKKVKGTEQIAQSREEGVLQSKLEGKSNIMPIWDFVEAESSQREPVLYQFMPLAGFGDGEALRNQLEGITTAKEREQILAHVAKGLLTGVFNMHQAAIYHLDVKPANMVFDMKGELFVIDFGCANELPDGWIQEIISGDTKYFSPERMEFHRQVHNGRQPAPIAANRVDSWAVGLSLLELAIGDYPFDRTSVIERFEKWDPAYFQRKLDEIPLIKNPAPGSLMAIVKGLLDVDPQKRLNITDALAQVSAKKPFSSSSEQEAAFAHLKQLDPSSTQLTEPSPSREQNEDYEHVYFQKFGDQSDYTHPMPTRSTDSTSYTDPIPRPGDAAEYTSPIPPPGNNF